MVDEKLFNNCLKYTWDNLFPKQVENKPLVYLTNILHIIGVAFIQFGILLPPKYLYYYIFYLIFLFMTYFYFKNRCFMTILSNYMGRSYYDSLCIKMSQAKFILIIYLFYASLSICYPKIALFNIVIKPFINYCCSPK